MISKSTLIAAAAIMGDIPLPDSQPLPMIGTRLETNNQHRSKGKRSRKRRAAILRAAGHQHCDGYGWMHKSEMTSQSGVDILLTPC